MSQLDLDDPIERPVKCKTLIVRKLPKLNLDVEP